MVANKWCYFFFCLVSIAALPFLNFFSADEFKLETSVWCNLGANQTKLCKFKNICYDSEYKAFLFFLNKETVIKGFNHYSELKRLQLSTVEQHNQFYANISVIDVENYTLTKKLKIYSKTLLLSRFKPNNIMHNIHDDIFPIFLTLELVCLGDLQCMKSYDLIFHDNHPEGPFFSLYKIFSKHSPIILNKLKFDSNPLLCFKEMLTGLVVESIFYQYGFEKPHGPVKPFQLTQNDLLRFTSFLKKELHVQDPKKSTSEVILLKRQKNRKILNVEQIKQMIQKAYEKYNKKIQVNIMSINLYFDDLPTIVEKISQADGLIGMHGAEMILSLFLKPNSYVIEMFPFGIKSETVSFIKPVSQLNGSNFLYFSWENKLKNNSIVHPNAHPMFGGISHLDQATQDKIRNALEVPPLKCCNNPIFLYHMYQDTFISNEFRKLLDETLAKALIHVSESKLNQTTKNWFFPYSVSNFSCSFWSDKKVLHLSWDPPFNAKSSSMSYSLYIKDQKGLFNNDVSTNKTILEIEIPLGINPTFEVWISAHFSSNSFQSPDLYIKCY